jgi:hypothetical protein
LMSWMNKPRLTQLPQWHCLGSCPSWLSPCLSFGRLCTPLIPITFVLDQNVHKLSTGWKYPWILPQRRMPIHTLPQGWNELVFVIFGVLDEVLSSLAMPSMIPPVGYERVTKSALHFFILAHYSRGLSNMVLWLIFVGSNSFPM